ncbi:hypothetical protein SAMN05216328_1244 [Ensifer sp. YR511]|nr:hypothetical protein SAMN05216328_1244 [Ensifer sp. YR511]
MAEIIAFPHRVSDTGAEHVAEQKDQYTRVEQSIDLMMKQIEITKTAIANFISSHGPNSKDP